MEVRGVVHMHSVHSYDGKVALSELKKQLHADGISFACMTEHTNELTKEKADAFVAECRALSDESFVFVPGFEQAYFQEGMTKDTHVLLIGADEFVCQLAREAASLRNAASRARLVVLAHPIRNQFKLDDILHEIIDGVEIWNRQYDGKNVPRTRAYCLLEELRKEKPELLAIGGLDYHRTHHFTYPRYTIEVSSLTEGNVLRALQAGSYTFGNRKHTLTARDAWNEASNFNVRVQSSVATSFIATSKKIRKFCKKMGVPVPRTLVDAIQRKV